jgi:DNA (cytosine-5)-methyltransferase 1
MFDYLEFFAGGGMARAGLGKGWQCQLANDFDPQKAAAYVDNWGGEHFVEGDVRLIQANDIPGQVDLAWASFPCQDLSLAGAGAGLKGERSGTFWPFWDLVKSFVSQDRQPRIVVLENVYGALRSHDGEDFAAIGNALADSGYYFGAVVVDAVHFVPQSRQRLFIVGIHESVAIPNEVTSVNPDPVWHPVALHDAMSKLSKLASSKWIWLDLGKLPKRSIEFSDVIEDSPTGVEWHSEEVTRKLLNMMSDVNKTKVEEAKKAGSLKVGGIYKRTRSGVQRAEIRFDVSGCLRTPAGGSSRQTILIVEGKNIRSRLLSPREAARLMGLPDSYRLPKRYNDAYHLAGDGLVVPVVRFLAEKVLEPVLYFDRKTKKKVA